jgi:hypothetical protein
MNNNFGTILFSCYSGFDLDSTRTMDVDLSKEALYIKSILEVVGRFHVTDLWIYSQIA